jgi:hypothetical protein
VEEAPATPAERFPVETRATVDRAIATTGDIINYRVTVNYDAGYDVEIPEPGAEIAGFRIIDVGREEPRPLRDGRIEEERWYQLRADLIGSYVLPPVTVSYRERSEAKREPESDDSTVPLDSDLESVKTSAIFVEVESVLPTDGQAEDIRDLKPLRRIQPRWPWPWIGVAIAGVLALLGAALYFLRRARRGLEEPATPPHERAFELLRALRETDFEDPEAVRRFYFSISEAIREYVEGRYGLNATDLTTEEIVSALPTLEKLGGEERGSLRLFLVDTDQVKFADHEPSQPEIEETYERALDFVETTRPMELEEEVA